MDAPILIVAAYEPELAGLPAGLPGVVREAVGIGPLDAAAGMASALARHRPRRVWLAGTCGAFAGTGLDVGRVVVVTRAAASPVAGVEVPGPPVEGAAHAALVAAAVAAGSAAVVAACAAGVTVDDAVAGTIARATGAQVEHMECLAVYRACARAGVPVAAILAVANQVGAGARAQWRANARAAEAAAVRGVVAAERALGA